MISFKGLPHKLDEYNRRQHINAINGDRVLTSLFAASKQTSEFKFHPYSMCVHTVLIESSRASTLTTRLKG
jgi:hypothetical protein